MERGFGRRSPRLRLGMPARLITPERTWPVVLEDLSAIGARVTQSEAEESVVCVLRWMDYHAFADVAWRDGTAMGLRFDKPLATSTIEATRLYFSEMIAQPRPDEARWRTC